MRELTPAQRAFILTINDGLGAISSAQDDLSKRSDLPHLGDDPVSSPIVFIAAFNHENRSYRFNLFC